MRALSFEEYPACTRGCESSAARDRLRHHGEREEQRNEKTNALHLFPAFRSWLCATSHEPFVTLFTPAIIRWTLAHIALNDGENIRRSINQLSLHRLALSALALRGRHVGPVLIAICNPIDYGLLNIKGQGGACVHVGFAATHATARYSISAPMMRMLSATIHNSCGDTTKPPTTMPAEVNNGG